MLKLITLLFLLPLFVTTSCGGGDSDSAALSNNACGVLGLEARAYSSRIINGTECVNPNNAPVVRVVLNIDSFRGALCSGTFITPNKVLTAAHCFLDNPTSTIVSVGNTSSTRKDYRAVRVDIHPNFANGDRTLLRDVAVITLGENVSTPTLPILARVSLSSGDITSIFGYGIDENGNSNFNRLLSGEMRVSEVTVANIRADFNGEGSNTCLGDSGGPIVYITDERATIAGLTSTGINADCTSGDQSYFTNIQDPEVLSFLSQVAPNASYW